MVKDMLSGKTYTLKCKVIINATGVFADELMKKDDHTHKNMVSPSQGIHIVVDKKHYNSDKALLIPKTTDGRILFAVPWHQKVVIGTTDVKTHEIATEPKATNEEIRFVMDNFNRYTNQQLTLADIKSVFADPPSIFLTVFLNRWYAPVRRGVVAVWDCQPFAKSSRCTAEPLLPRVVKGRVQ